MAEETTSGADLPEDIQRCTAKRRVALVVSILRGESTVVEVARKHNLTVAYIEHWKDAFLLGAENALRSRPKGGSVLDPPLQHPAPALGPRLQEPGGRFAARPAGESER